MSIDPTDATCVPLATGSSRSDKIRAVAQQAHDNGDCVCCLPDEMVEFERAKQTTITITISREDAEAFVQDNRDPVLSDALGWVIWTALKGKR